ncbi:MAG: STAS domain-containing protein [Acidobacteria bacterium]|nr:STAS domain-containing protein [Acidobacteriota bacterium]
MPLHLRTRQEEAAVVVALKGHLILDNGTMLHDEIKSLFAGGAHKVVVDLAGVDFIDSHGIGQLVACQTTASERQGEVRFVGLRPKLMQALQITGVPSVLKFEPDLPTALGKLGEA